MGASCIGELPKSTVLGAACSLKDEHYYLFILPFFVYISKAIKGVKCNLYSAFFPYLMNERC